MLKEVLLGAYTTIESNKSAALVFLFAAVLVYNLVLYPFYISPFKSIPGPYLFRISRLPCLHYQRTNQWVYKVHELHKVYGDVVVLAPNEISVNGDPKYLNDIYTKNFPKSKFYENFRNHGFKDNMFSSLENDRHLNYKKNITSIYSKSAVFNGKNTTRSVILKKVEKLLRNIKESSGGKTTNLGIDVYSLFGALALDVVTAFELGSENSTDLLDFPEKRSIVTYHRYVASMVFYTTLMPQFWDMAATELIKKSSAIVEKWQLGIYHKAEENVPVLTPEQNTTTLELLKKNNLTGEYAYSFLSDNIFAGHETTAIQLTYLTYELSRPKHHYLQRMLKEELDKEFGAPSRETDVIEDFERVDTLPVLNALILENSRVHTSIPGAEPRVVDRPYTVNGTVIPPNTVISVQPYSYHRVEKVFPKPDHFVAERWLPRENESESQYASRFKLMNKYMIPFGKGVRMCLGMNIAQIEMKMAIANIYWHYNSKICENWAQIVEYDDLEKLPEPIKTANQVGDKLTDESKMTMFDTYTTRPYDDECWLEFYRNKY
ncbi:hypothetical protein CANTEDRAFT_106911 [Yamadazyma tenuis ATCC 10573]|uniref:Cytochrome P450 n=1 Tax=Candida tenuis (strain ATCC 10573 / BCRC 21748 / CBS 615 / JCM 9827 / NBRC 10315 / NRRL Y-1498 / VKM Y-70) TaxID=590646 RepID=G3B6I7_CANTC|nr:uncharacterized protein CANTEDRAFT_106911 [Yamadazyma tenuis ATCC 10573]EGV63479.1 hypothetical protein CANTEDRAFT_106911 [Yamadazyma tenuis ATCC 10573]